MTEEFLQYVWQHQLFAAGHDLTTTDGQVLTVHRAGELNRDAGPDFFNARITLDGVDWVGNIEVHIHTSDWKAHHHSQDKRYNNIVLHVVYEHDCRITLENGKEPPTLQLKDYIPDGLEAQCEHLLRSSETIPCAAKLPALPSFLLNNYLDRLVVERIEGKSDVVRRLLDESHGSWEQTCYWLMAHYFGGRVNALPFELTAKATDRRLLARWKDNPQRIEALLMGQAGLLEGYFEDDYPRQLQADYEAIRTGASLEPVGSYLWRFYRLRPSAFPTIRISQFAHLVSQSSSLFSTLLAISDAKEIAALFNQQASAYWDDHYRFGLRSAKSTPKRIGKMQASLLVINAWIPLLFVYGATHGQQEYKDRAVDLLMQLPPEDNRIVRQWAAAGIVPENAAQSQALLQQYNSYCHNHRCLSCRIGYHVLKNV